MPDDRRRAVASERRFTRDRRAIALVAAGALAFLVWLFWTRAPRVENLASTGTTIVAFGDSLTAGFGAADGQDYPSRLAELIGRPVVNAGRSGDTTASALSRLEEDVLSGDPRLVIVGLGGNDFLRRDPIAKTEANLRTIVRRIKSAGAMVVLLGFEFPTLGASYGDMYERIAETEGCLLVEDVADGILNDPALKSDEIHPNARGYALMAQRVAGPTEKLLQRADDAR